MILMRKPLFFLFLFFLASGSEAQMLTGLTGKPDTSYSTASAYRSTRKKYPNIQVVEEKKMEGVKEKRNLLYCQVNKHKLCLDAFYPAKKSKRGVPAILIIHGGGWRSGSRTQHIPLAQRLAANGYACFTVQYRLSTDALYPAAVHDLKSAVQWVRANAAKFNADPSRIVTLGFSAGGELASFIGATNKKAEFEGDGCKHSVASDVQAVVDIDGTLSFVHPESGEGDDTKSISAGTYWFGYKKKENPALWKEASPLTHVGKDTPPFLFINSSVDRMHAGRDDFRRVLDSCGTYSEVRSFPDSPHGFCLFEPWFTPTVDYITAFLRKVFKES